MFIKTKEDFICDNCGLKVRGNGYTNHCPRCLWSKHVDRYPGDRLEACRGLMKPTGIERKGAQVSIIHKCLKCGATRLNKASKQDSSKSILDLSINPVPLY